MHQNKIKLTEVWDVFGQAVLGRDGLKKIVLNGDNSVDLVFDKPRPRVEKIFNVRKLVYEEIEE